ncbi:hypothetical protein D3C84_1169620 [compost metagenome]
MRCLDSWSGGDLLDLGLQCRHLLIAATQLLLHGVKLGLQLSNMLAQFSALGVTLGNAGIYPLLGLGQRFQGRTGRCHDSRD